MRLFPRGKRGLKVGSEEPHRHSFVAVSDLQILIGVLRGDFLNLDPSFFHDGRELPGKEDLIPEAGLGLDERDLLVSHVLLRPNHEIRLLGERMIGTIDGGAALNQQTPEGHGLVQSPGEDAASLAPEADLVSRGEDLVDTFALC